MGSLGYLEVSTHLEALGCTFTSEEYSLILNVCKARFTYAGRELLLLMKNGEWWFELPGTPVRKPHKWTTLEECDHELNVMRNFLNQT
jgi:hypothetical protein